MIKKKRMPKSNKFMTVDYAKLSHREYRALMRCSEKAEVRKAAAQKLVDYLCKKYNIPRCIVWVADRMAPIRRGGSFVGTYYPNNMVMTIWNNEDFLKPCSIETFASTVLHEFMHHYDAHYLKLSKSPICEGFYARLHDLTNKLSS